LRKFEWLISAIPLEFNQLDATLKASSYFYKSLNWAAETSGPKPKLPSRYLLKNALMSKEVPVVCPAKGGSWKN